LSNDGPTVTDFTADVVRVKVSGSWLDMAKVGSAPSTIRQWKRVW